MFIPSYPFENAEVSIHAQPVDRSLVTSGAWHCKKWLNHLSCPANTTLGFPEVFPYYSKLKHESQCNFRPYSCPYAGSECSVIGDIPFLVAHLRDDHKVDMHSGCTFNHLYVKSTPRGQKCNMDANCKYPLIHGFLLTMQF
jgi:hypothetical protein